MKLMKLTLLLALLGFSAIEPTYGQAKALDKIATFVDDKPLQSDKAAFLDGESLFIPIRAVLEQMGWTVGWEGKTITLSYQSYYSNQDSLGINIALIAENLEDGNEYMRLIEGSAYMESSIFVNTTNSEIEFNEAANRLGIRSGDPTKGIWGELDGGEEPETPEELEEEESIAINFGKYEVPPTLKALIEAEADLRKDGYELWDVIGFYPSLGHSGYFNSPVDVVTFGWTGVDGEHFGFLTEFGSAANLEEAPIVMVSPMNFDQPAVVVANNIREFMRIVMKDYSLLFMGYENEQEYLESEREMREELEGDYGYTETEEERLAKQAVLRVLEEKLHPPIINDVYRYSEKVALDRENRIVMATRDKLGVTNVHPDDAGKPQPPLSVNEEMEASDLIDLLAEATYVQKLALIRDINLDTPDYDDIFMEKLLKEMISIGLQDEAARFQAMYSY